MTWNWQQPDWPHFSWDSSHLAPLEERFLLAAGTLGGTHRHLNSEDRDLFTVQVMSAEAVTTSEIEGEILDGASVRSSIRRHLGLATEAHRTKPAEQGIGEMMVHLHQGYREQLSEATLFSWHQMLMRGREDLADSGQYRTSADAMQVISGPVPSRKIHFEAPPSSTMPNEMREFIRWFNASGPEAADHLPALTRAGIAHLYFVSIHPFEDGNGRLARAIAEKALAQGARQAPLLALAPTILKKRKAYYDMLEAANKHNRITPWLAWFAEVALEAQAATLAHIEFFLAKSRLLDRLRGRLNARQEKALLRMLREGPEGFQGGLSAGNYASITGASPATTTRDLVDLVEKGALTRTGERRHARYHLALG